MSLLEFLNLPMPIWAMLGAYAIPVLLWWCSRDKGAN